MCPHHTLFFRLFLRPPLSLLTFFECRLRALSDLAVVRQLYQDPFGNYVLQACLSRAPAVERQELLDVLYPLIQVSDVCVCVRVCVHEPNTL